MTKPVCVKCDLLMSLSTIGIYLVEMSEDGPYKVWSADLCRCPGCGVEVVCRFGSKSIAEHWEPEFSGWLEVCRKEGDHKFWGSLKELESYRVSHESAKSPVESGSSAQEVDRKEEVE